MSETLFERLKKLGVQPGTQHLQKEEKAPVQLVKPIREFVQGETVSTVYGDAFLVEENYPPEYTHGDAPLDCTLERQIIAEWAGIPAIRDLDLTQFVFLDTETSGLGPGSGTIVFLVGLGFFTPDGFTVQQFFLEDPTQESAFLAALSEAIHPFSVLVTYNGKSFDAPVLNARYTLSALSTPLPDLAHLDLLHLARKLWKIRLQNRSLKDLEAAILNFHRTEDDVPGWLVPEYYYDYLRSGDASRIAGVLYHNRVDIVSLAAVFRQMSMTLADPFAESNHELELVAIARLFEDLGRNEDAIRLYQTCLGLPLPVEVYQQALQRFAALLKRQGDYAKALPVWELLLRRGDLDAGVELAKYYEHQARDYSHALEVAQLVLEQVVKHAGVIAGCAVTQAEIRTRCERLERKLQRGSECP